MKMGWSLRQLADFCSRRKSSRAADITEEPSLTQTCENSNPHDMDGVADHVGGAALAFGTSGHYAFFPVAAPCFWMKTFICSRSEVVADAGLNPRHAFRKSKS
jgi:hypothetical protein